MASNLAPLEVPPYQVQPLLATVIESYGRQHFHLAVLSVKVVRVHIISSAIGYNTSEIGLPTVEVKCAQALGSPLFYTVFHRLASVTNLYRLSTLIYRL